MSKWETVKLGDIATYINGYAFKPSDWSDTGLPIIRIQNLTGNDYETNYYSGDYNKKYEVVDGDILISWSASLGVYEWKKGKALLNQHIFKVVFDKLTVDKSYFVYTVTHLLDDMAKETHGSTMKHITKPHFDNTPFPLPPLEIQKQIAANLDKATQTIDLCNAILEKLDLLVKARFVEMFGDMVANDKQWHTFKLTEVSDIVSGITKGRKIKETKLIEVPYMAVSNVKDGYIDWTTVKTILATESEIAQYRIIPEDILMTEGGDPDKLGRGSIIYQVPENCIHQNHIFRVRLNLKRIAPIFFSEYLKHQGAKQYFLKCAKQTTGIASINMTQLKALPVFIPPLELQTQFAAFVEKSDRTKAAVKQVLAKAETLKKALMQEYFG